MRSGLCRSVYLNVINIPSEYTVAGGVFMTEVFFKIIITVFCIFGVAEFLHIVKQNIFAPEQKPETRLIVYLSGDTPDLQLACIINEFNWYRKLKPKKIVGVYSVIDDAALESCHRMAQRHNISLVSDDDFEKINDFNLIWEGFCGG